MVHRIILTILVVTENYSTYFTYNVLKLAIKMYITLTCDLVSSKNATDRYAVQQELKEAISKINNVFSKKILSPFVIVWGDSFQGVLNSLNDFYTSLETIEECLSIDFRCGLGIGTINTPFSTNPLEMDGPAFHRSQKALMIAEKERRSVWILSEKESFDSVVNTIVTLLTTLKKWWTPRQQDIIKLRKKKLTYKKIGEKMEITKQAVSIILKSAHWEEVSLAIETLNNLNYEAF